MAALVSAVGGVAVAEALATFNTITTIPSAVSPWLPLDSDVGRLQRLVDELDVVHFVAVVASLVDTSTTTCTVACAGVQETLVTLRGVLRDIRDVGRLYHQTWVFAGYRTGPRARLLMGRLSLETRRLRHRVDLWGCCQ